MRSFLLLLFFFLSNMMIPLLQFVASFTPPNKKKNNNMSGGGIGGGFAEKRGIGGGFIDTSKLTVVEDFTVPPKVATKLATEWVNAWSNRNIDDIMSHFTDNVSFTSPFVASIAGESSGTLHGKDALQAYFQAALDKYPTIEFKMLHVFPGMNTIALYYESINNLMACEIMWLDQSFTKVYKVLNHYCPKTSSSHSDESMLSDDEHLQAIEFGTQWINARNTCNLDAIMDCFDNNNDDDKLQYTSTHTTAGTLVGKMAIRDYFASVLEEYSDMKYELINALPGNGKDDTIALIYKSTPSGSAAPSDGDTPSDGDNGAAISNIGSSSSSSTSSDSSNNTTLYCCEIIFWRSNNNNGISSSSNEQEKQTKKKVFRILKYYITK